ncbi:hypothetical protein QJS10_CPA10g00425 [Acorus calamus]|uniref:Transposase n=1 Tax=Acorus calamus TaxID=4465 RepID=A0AAV9E0Q1_ACOCL|nr:hypothetical protein QJS10_CPA10g00425 [Acorus calamus]
MKYGFNPTYTVWYLHGENVEDNIGECSNKDKEDVLNTILEGLGNNIDQIVQDELPVVPECENVFEDNIETDFMDSDSQSSHPESLASTSSKRRGPTRGIFSKSEGKKTVCINELGQPNANSEALGSAIGILVRSHIPITYKSYADVPSEYKKKVTDTLNEKFEFDGTGVVVGKYLDERMNAMFRSHKYGLKVKYVKDKDPAVVKEGPIPPNVSKEDWRTFVDMCNSEEHKTISDRNVVNRSKLKSPSTLGRKSMAVVRHEMAMERNATSDAEISRSEVYIRAHTKKDKTVQIPDVIVLGNDSRGRMRGMGAGINKTVFKNATSMITKNLKLEKEKMQMGEKIEILQEEMKNVKALLANMNVPQTTASVGVVRSGGSQTHNVGGSGGLPNTSTEAPPVSDMLIGKKCSLLNYDYEIVAHGEIVSVDPLLNVHGSRMGNGFYKVVLVEIIVEDADLFKNDGYHYTLGEVGVGGFVVWHRRFETCESSILFRFFLYIEVLSSA